eukprot:scaffold649_cov347-Pavlova_lutheri.AAC.80
MALAPKNRDLDGSIGIARISLSLKASALIEQGDESNITAALTIGEKQHLKMPEASPCAPSQKTYVEGSRGVHERGWHRRMCNEHPLSPFLHMEESVDCEVGEGEAQQKEVGQRIVSPSAKCLSCRTGPR